MATRQEMIETIHQVAGSDETFLYNECIDIADILCMVRDRLKKMKKEKLTVIYDKAKTSIYCEVIENSK